MDALQLVHEAQGVEDAAGPVAEDAHGAAQGAVAPDGEADGELFAVDYLELNYLGLRRVWFRSVLVLLLLLLRLSLRRWRGRWG